MRPERIVHIGLGAFFRAHQAWYTEHASDSKDWGIVAYTGRSPLQAELINQRNGNYTLLTRSSDSDQLEQISSIVRAEPASNFEDFCQTVAKETTAIITLTITEAGYLEDEVSLESVLGRLVIALERRRLANGQAIALVPCDNLPANGELLKKRLISLSRLVTQETVEYVESLSFVSTSIDRITPKTTPEDISMAAESLGFEDQGLVVTEPFSDWVLSGDFPKGRPNWESAGAKFVDDIEPFENRKLWLLNGSHSLIAYAGSLKSYQSVAQAISDPEILEMVNRLWDECSMNLDEEVLNISNYRDALLERFRNPRIKHLLHQIAKDGSNKLPVRIGEVAKLELAAGRNPIGAAGAVAAWAGCAKSGLIEQDPKLQEIQLAAGQTDWVRGLVELVDPVLAANINFLALVRESAGALGNM